MAGFYIFLAFLSIVGSSRLDFLTVLDSPRWRNMMKNNKYGVLEKLNAAPKSIPYISRNLYFFLFGQLYCCTG